MKTPKWIAGPMALACVTITGLASAQPPAAPGAGANPPNQQVGGGRPNFQNMTPEQRQQMIEQFIERRLRTSLTDAGFADAATQDPIVAFVKAQEKLRAPLRDKATKLRDAVTNKAADADTTALLTDLRTATEDAKKQRETALKTLDTQVSYTKKPRLEAFLTVGGYLGDEMAFAGGAGGRGGAGGFGGGAGGAGGAGGFGGGAGGAAGFGGRGGAGGQGGPGGRRGGRGGNNNANNN